MVMGSVLWMKGGGLGRARNIVQCYALETASGAGPRLRQEEQVMGRLFIGLPV
jgi:hypothetical protein